ncbi:MAG: hypothetical protein HYV13_03690, partial [Candidatus Doudnabacteria bacterium]|nr:hypothetical protein [Candidatus Doudnabacteria bacterium]
MHSVLHKRLTAFKSLTVVLISTGMVIIGTLAFAFLPTEAQMKVADGFRIFDFSEKWQEPIGGVSFALEVADDFYEEFYLALGQVSAPFGKYGESLVVAYQSNATAFKPSDEIWMPRVAGESLDSNSPQPPLNLRETPSLTTRRGLGGTASGKAGELYTQELTQVIREINNYTLKASLTEQELLDLISASDQLKQMLKGEKGDKGDQGSQGPAGAGITYSSPNITNPGSFGG